MTQRLLVVDWDYFFPIDTEGPHWGLYDWGHSETSHYGVYLNTIWPIRAAGFLRAGLPLPGTSGMEEHFWKRFKLAPGATLRVADSNVRAFCPEEYGKLSSVRLYDAHHDSGYRGTLEEIEERDQVDCGDWMCAYWLNGVKRLHVFYPTWRQQHPGSEWGGPSPLIPVTRQIDYYEPVDVTFHHVFICRSGVWVPPWLDDQFEAFVEACPAKGTRWRDPTLTKRKWDPAEVDLHLTAWQRLEAEAEALEGEGNVDNRLGVGLP